MKGLKREVKKARKRVPAVAKKLATHFKANNWRWYGSHVPKRGEIEEVIDSLLDSLSADVDFAETGRLRVETIVDGGRCCGVRMFAIIEP